MDVEQVLQLADAAVFAKTKRHLKDIEVIILRGSLQGMKYDEIAKAHGYTAEYIKCDVGSKLWKLLSEALGEKVSKNNFQAALKRRWQSQQEQVAQPQQLTPPDSITETAPNFGSNQYLSMNQRQDWGDAPDFSVVFGRTYELATLEQWILHEQVGFSNETRSRLVAILGMGGIGKTHLSLKLARGLQDEFEYVIWRSLLNTHSLTYLLADLIEFLSNRQEIELPDTVDGRISRLLHYLRSSRCLLILDNAEAILRGGDSTGQYREGYEDYGQLLKKVGEVPHQSCLLVISREEPQEIALLKDETGPVRSLYLSGLNESDSRKIFTRINSCSGSDDDWRELIKLYNGNPLALKLAAKHIKDVFFGNISHFLREGKPVFGNLWDLLDWHFERLSDLEKEIMYWLVINHEPVSFSELREDIFSSVVKEKLPETLQSLQRRLPLETRETGFTLPHLLMEYMVQRLIEQLCQEITTGKFVFLNSHILLKTTAKNYIKERLCRFILKPILDRLIFALGTQNKLEVHLNQILTKLREEYQGQPGYAVSNLLILLFQLKTNFSNQDFSWLTICQPYLQGLNLQNVNFAHSALANEYTQTYGTTVPDCAIGSILSVVFSQDGKLLALGGANGIVCVWKVADGQQVLIGQRHIGCVRAVAFSCNGQILASGGDDQTVMIWDIRTGQCLKTFCGHSKSVRSLAFSPDGQTLASSSEDRTIRLWDVFTSQCLNTLQGHNGWVMSVAFSPDGSILASGGEDQTVRLWDVHTGECLNSLRGHTNRVYSVTFSPDGLMLASSSEDQTVRLWNVYTGQCLNTLKNTQNATSSIISNFLPHSQTNVP